MKRSVNQYQQPRRLRGVSSSTWRLRRLEPFDWLTRTLGLRKHPNASINGNWGPMPASPATSTLPTAARRAA